MLHLWGEIVLVFILRKFLDQVVVFCVLKDAFWVQVGILFIHSLESGLYTHEILVSQVHSIQNVAHVIRMSLFLLCESYLLLGLRVTVLWDNWDKLVIWLHLTEASLVHVDFWQHSVSETEGGILTMVGLIVYECLFDIGVVLQAWVDTRLDWHWAFLRVAVDLITKFCLRLVSQKDAF